MRNLLEDKPVPLLFWRYNSAAILWIAFILLLTLMPGQELPPTGAIFTFDKIAHVGVFAVLGFLLIVGFIKQHSIAILHNRPLLSSFLLVGLLGSGIEVCQAFIPGRSVDVIDLSADLTGGLVGIFIFYLIYKMPIK